MLQLLGENKDKHRASYGVKQGRLVPIMRGVLVEAGDAALLITLAASASYIAVPAAMRLALPKARPSIYLTLSLGITFPFNLILGLPLYIWLARAISPGAS